MHPMKVITPFCSNKQQRMLQRRNRGSIVHVSNVNVSMPSVDATCNTGSDGSFVIDNVACGLNPFSFVVNGVAGPAPTDFTRNI